MEHEFKIGDRVRCKSGFKNTDYQADSGGAGYSEGLEFTINRFTSDGKCSWGNGTKDGNGVWIQALELVEPKEPEETLLTTIL